MNRSWAVRLEADEAAAAAGLGLEPLIEVCESAGALWLRGRAGGESIDRLLRRLPGALRFEVFPDGQLRPEGGRLPAGRLPDGPWVAIKSWAAVEFPVATLAGRCT